MASQRPDGLVAASALSEDELREARTLADRCNQLEGLTLKLNLSPGDSGLPTSRFLFFAHGALVGYAALEGGGMEAELCGMVDPAHRRRGIGRILLQAARDACKRDLIGRLLLICEEKSRSGQAFVRALGVPRDFSELHMEADAQPLPKRASTRLRMRQAAPGDLDQLARVIVAAFGGIEERVRRRVASELEEPGARFYVGELKHHVVAALKVYPDEGRAGIYAFGVLPEYRGQGYGRELLRWTMERMRVDGYPRIYLEVDLDNEPAKALYRSCGFVETTIYEYYDVPL